MTKPKSVYRRQKIGAPVFPALEMFVMFEGTRRLAGRSINAHAKAFKILMVDAGLPDMQRVVTGEALRRHIHIFRKQHVIGADPVILDGLERMIATHMSLVQQ